ncbi:DUF4012 domain-containing protein [Candidatus Roizmanbacteria bacterium]|nr:DUF4012 domain-containing protein [Candidatus Roizmanbacteria bacterium]
MADKHAPYLRSEEVPQDYTILIIADAAPFLADALSDALVRQGGTVYTSWKKSLSVDYVIIIDSHTKLKKALQSLKSGGKILHVISREAIGHIDIDHIPVFILPPHKTYKRHVLVNTILSELFASNPYFPPQPKKKPQKKTAKKSVLIPQKSARFRWLVPLASGILLVLVSPVILMAAAVGISLRTISQIRDPALTHDVRIQKAKTAQATSGVARSVSHVVIPVVEVFSPEIATILEKHLIILSSVTDTVRLASEQAQLLEPVIRAVTSGATHNIEQDIANIQHSLTGLSTTIKPAVQAVDEIRPFKEHRLVHPVWSYYEQIEEADLLLSKGTAFMETVPDLMAFKTRKKYLILLQNNFELRPTGGFIGSFALITMENGGIKEISVEDVYEADGQLKGQVDPPEAIRKHLNQPNWFLRDSNWNPDFALSAKQAEWFLQKELGEEVNGVIAIDLYFLKNILAATGGIYVPDYQATVTADDFFHKLQSDTHEAFFPGSNKKRNLIDALTTALLIDITEQDPVTLLRIAKSVEESFEEKHILLSSHDTNVQQTAEQLGWAGRIASHQDVLGTSSNMVADYIMVVDANLGVNKVNTHINREIFTTVEQAEHTVERELVVYYQNTSTQMPDSLYDGVYKNYLRVFLPREVFVHFIGIDDQDVSMLDQADIESYGDKTSIGLLVEIPPQQDVRVVLKYSLPRPETDAYSYQLMVQKQPGTRTDPLVFKLGNLAQSSVINSNISSFPYMIPLDHDRLLTVDFN